MPEFNIRQLRQNQERPGGSETLDRCRRQAHLARLGEEDQRDHDAPRRRDRHEEIPRFVR